MTRKITGFTCMHTNTFHWGMGATKIPSRFPKTAAPPPPPVEAVPVPFNTAPQGVQEGGGYPNMYGVQMFVMKR